MHVALGIIIALFIIVVIAMWHVAMEEKSKVERMDRQPMTICDKHGPYLSKFSVYIDVPAEGKKDLRQEQCPMCFHEKMQEAQKMLKANVKRSFDASR